MRETIKITVTSLVGRFRRKRRGRLSEPSLPWKQFVRNVSACVILLLGLTVNLSSARTVVLEGQEIDLAAGIAVDAPRMGWAMSWLRSGIYTTALLDLVPNRSFLFRFPLDQIPAGERITQAEIILPIEVIEGTDPRLYVWRVTTAWGVGACYDYRITVPQKIAWTRPGAGGRFSDRAGRPTVVARLVTPGQKVLNVTEDVELWKAGAATNWGWLLTVEDPGVRVQLASPVGTGERQWKLRITHEPE